MKGALIFSALVLLVLLYQNESSSVKHPPGILAPHEPVQYEVARAPSLVRKGYEIQALARFSIEARVLRAERYRFDRGADLAPVDLALGWGAMSDSAVLEKIRITQGQRFYEWGVSASPPIALRDIETHSANMHMVPADEAVEKVLKEARAGNIVKLSGYLIEIRGADGYRWRSSLTRQDTGPGACEVIWVERIELR
jgi:hypothetical protein